MDVGARASMEPVGFTVKARLSSGEAHVVEGACFASVEDAAVSAWPSFDGEVLELALDVHARLVLERVAVELRHAFATDELVLLNGYQSWTDTAERSPWSRMRGLRGMPEAVVERYSLDALGDYRFAEYSARRGVQHGYTYATFRRGGGMVLVGSLDERRGFTEICIDASSGTVVLETECPVREIEPGQRVVLARYAVVRGDQDACYDRWFSLSNITARPVKPLVGYSSWYRHYDRIDEEKLRGDLDGMRRSALGWRARPAGKHAASPDERPAEALSPGAGAAPANADVAELLGRAEILFQIDDGYCKVGDWTQVDEGKFPRGLSPLVEAADNAGFLPGLWVAPFVCERDSRVFRECGDWLLRDGEGELVRTGSHWSGGYALDTRNVEVRSYVLDVLRTITQEWGFGLVKADFLYAACLVAHDGLNRGELMADAMGLLRRGVGDALVLGCGVPLASAFGIVDYCRIGCDVGLDWGDRLPLRLLHRERVSTKRSLGNTYGRAPLDGRAFGNDPDVVFLRDDVKLSDAQRDELLFADADLGSVLLTSDDMAGWDEAQNDRFEQALRIFLGRKAQSR